jgi:hypothetical protein
MGNMRGGKQLNGIPSIADFNMAHRWKSPLTIISERSAIVMPGQVLA